MSLVVGSKVVDAEINQEEKTVKLNVISDENQGRIPPGEWLPIYLIASYDAMGDAVYSCPVFEGTSYIKEKKDKLSNLSGLHWETDEQGNERIDCG